MSQNGNKSLKGRTLYVHSMTQAGARMIAAGFRSVGIDARNTSPSDERTMELGAIACQGDECLPKKITFGDYLKIAESPGFAAEKTAFLMPTAQGPCRFGQYWTSLETVIENRGLDDVMIVSPSSKNGYEGIGEQNLTFYRSMWIGLVSSDITRKMLLKTRPYERFAGTTDKIYEESLVRLEKVFEIPGMPYSKRFEMVHKALSDIREAFRSIDARYVKGKPLIAVVGEIFCRHNRFANENIIRKLEEFGAETWIADVAEWVVYTDWSRRQNLARVGRAFSKDMFATIAKQYVMKRDEHKLVSIFHDDFIGYEEPSETDVIVKLGEPYLPANGALGEMALSVGRAVYMYEKGADGVVDISPFSCMNGIVSEAVYPDISRDHNTIPCHVFYFDGINSDLDRDIGIFMELVRGYMSRKKVRRVYPDFFVES